MQAAQPQWFAVFTKQRQERIARDNLERQGFCCFLPEAKNPFQRRSLRQRPQIEPLFPRYLFLNAICEQQSLASVRSTRGVNDLVRFGLKLATVPEKIIQELKACIEPATGLLPIKPVALMPGEQVRVFDGPLAGVQGILQQYNGEHRAILLMELLGRQTRVEIDTLLLQRA